ncbi:hypothetical protein I552_0446 [Mycobacterium xenopi 3993]|nr:hypothetical protein I552_0446 [Mycobacterium xenopi 3993]
MISRPLSQGSDLGKLAANYQWAHKPDDCAPQIWITPEALDAIGFPIDGLTEDTLADTVEKFFSATIKYHKSGFFTCQWPGADDAEIRHEADVVLMPFTHLDPSPSRPEDRGVIGIAGTPTELPDDEIEAAHLLADRIEWLHSIEGALPAPRWSRVGVQIAEAWMKRARPKPKNSRTAPHCCRARCRPRSPRTAGFRLRGGTPTAGDDATAHSAKASTLSSTSRPPTCPRPRDSTSATENQHGCGRIRAYSTSNAHRSGCLRSACPPATTSTGCTAACPSRTPECPGKSPPPSGPPLSMSSSSSHPPRTAAPASPSLSSRSRRPGYGPNSTNGSKGGQGRCGPSWPPHACRAATTTRK